MKILDQVLHVLVFGILAAVHPALGVIGVGVYELSAVRWELGELTIGQWPPGDPITIFRNGDVEQFAYGEFEQGEQYQPLDRVEDLRLDLGFELLGVALGSIAQDVLMAAVL